MFEAAEEAPQRVRHLTGAMADHYGREGDSDREHFYRAAGGEVEFDLDVLARFDREDARGLAVELAQLAARCQAQFDLGALGWIEATVHGLDVYFDSRFGDWEA